MTTTLYVIRRLLILPLTVVAMVFLVFLALFMAPGDPVELLYDFERQQVSTEQLAAVRHELGLDRPLLVQFASYLGRVARGDLGTSFITKRSVAEEIVTNLPWTVQLALAGITITAVLGIPAGMLAALQQDTWVDHVALTGAVIGVAAPNFWVGMLLIYFVGYQLNWLPIVSTSVGMWGSFEGLILPAWTVGFHSTALLARLTRSSILEVLRQDYVRTAWAKGLRPWRVTWHHIMHNAAIPVVTTLGMNLAYLLGGSVLVETVFSRKGMGWLLVGAVNNRDFPMLQGLILVYGTLIVLINLTVDLLYGIMDPRVRYD